MAELLPLLPQWWWATKAQDRFKPKGPRMEPSCVLYGRLDFPKSLKGYSPLALVKGPVLLSSSIKVLPLRAFIPVFIPTSTYLSSYSINSHHPYRWPIDHQWVKSSMTSQSIIMEETSLALDCLQFLGEEWHYSKLCFLKNTYIFCFPLKGKAWWALLRYISKKN